MDIEELNQSQQAVACAPYSARQIVIAGPGSGKTTTATARLQSIDEQLKDAEHRWALFISFSRSAIKSSLSKNFEVLNELDLQIDPRTLDSYAYQLIGQDFFEDESNPNFEKRIHEAREVLKEQGEEIAQDYAHIIIDEGQDILGSRQQLLLELLRHIPEDCGVTLFADPAQSIYQFFEKTDQETLPTHEDPWTHFRNNLEKISAFSISTLHGSYRARSRTVKRLHSQLFDSRNEETKNDWIAELDKIQSELLRLDTDQLVEIIPRWKGSTTVLTRTNAEAVFIYESLKKSGVDVGVNLRSILPQAPDWIGKWANSTQEDFFTTQQIQYFLESENIDPSKIIEEIETFNDFEDLLSWKDLWNFSKELLNDKKTRPTNAITVETVHQSKGLEYDNVLIHNPEQYINSGDREAHQPEILFVALSRGMGKTIALDEKIPFHRNVEGKIILDSFRRKSPESICIFPADLRTDRPFGSTRGQNLLAQLPESSTLEFSLLPGGINFPLYRCHINNETVGMTTEDFGLFIKKLCHNSKWPNLSPVALDGVETRFGFIEEKVQAWLTPRPIGFSKISFN